MTWPGTTAPSRTTGTSRIPPMARMQALGGLMMAVNSAMPNMPRFEVVKVEPAYSLGSSAPSLARAARSRVSAPIWASPFRSASRTTGVMRPSGMATATATCAPACWRMTPSSSR